MKIKLSYKNKKGILISRTIDLNLKFSKKEKKQIKAYQELVESKMATTIKEGHPAITKLIEGGVNMIFEIIDDLGEISINND